MQVKFCKGEWTYGVLFHTHISPIGAPVVAPSTGEVTNLNADAQSI